MTSPKELLDKYTNHLPRFTDGRIDYTNAVHCVTLNSVVRCGDEVLLVKRSDKVGTYPNLWSGISGYVDTDATIEDVMKTELREEINVTDDITESIKVSDIVIQEDNDLNKIWHTYPVLVLLAEKPDIILNWETEKVEWVNMGAISSYNLIPGYEEIVFATTGIHV